MGHLRLGSLPKTRRWIQLFELLDESPQDAADIAASIVYAAGGKLEELESNRSIGYCFWLLTRIALASREPDFQNSLSKIGIAVENQTPMLSFLSQLTRQIHVATDDDISSGHFAELSSLAFRRTLSETVGQYSGNLFGSSVQSLQQAFNAYSKPEQFGSLSRKFFADFFARTSASLVDRQLSKHVGSNKSYKTCADSKAFMEALDLHTRESARIMETFASDWYSKHNWESKGEITQQEAQGFVAIAMRKLVSEFKVGAVEQ